MKIKPFKMRYFIIIISLLFSSYVYSQQTVGVFQNSEDAYNGYTLFAPISYTNTYLIDNCGNLINEWSADQSPGLSTTYLTAEGNLVRTGRSPSTGEFSGGGIGGRIEIFSWDNELIWRYDLASTEYHQHHDVEPLPNGNILAIVWERISEEEAISLGRDPASINESIWPTTIFELKPIGSNDVEIVWEWHLKDHLVQDIDPLKPNFGVIADHPELLDFNYNIPDSREDFIHANSIDYNDQLDQILISSHQTSEIWVIDHSTTTEEAAIHSGGIYGMGGDLLYRWGNPIIYDRGIEGDRMLFRQHNASWILNGFHDAGKISIFNNGVARPGGNYSSIDIIDPPIDGSGNYILEANNPFGPESLHWTYDGNSQTFFSMNMGGTEQLPNGNMLICNSSNGNLTEVDQNGNVQWRYVIPVNNLGPIVQGNIPSGNYIFRAIRYATDYTAFDGKDMTPGEPIETFPSLTNCMIYTVLSDYVIANQLVEMFFSLSDDYSILYIDNKTGLSDLYLRAYNSLGQLIYTERIDQVLHSVKMSTWTSGLVIIEVTNELGERLAVQKIVH